MTPKLARITLEFLQRVKIKPAEIQTFQEVQAAIIGDMNAPEPKQAPSGAEKG